MMFAVQMKLKVDETPAELKRVRIFIVLAFQMPVFWLNNKPTCNSVTLQLKQETATWNLLSVMCVIINNLN